MKHKKYYLEANAEIYLHLSEDKSCESITDDFNFNFILNCLAVGLERYCLIKTKKRHEKVDRGISTGAEIQSQLLPDYCPTIYGVDLAAHQTCIAIRWRLL